ncbi:MAG: hypothetical protein JWM01_1657 [Arthrobacter sp.]|jgi:hypothetical protein|nr:hypothetical protein [Arthrobacter sp.]MCU1540710.1 hypothetical protein [Arthrobacter sp.]
MSEKKDESTQKDQVGYVGSPTTGQMRSVGQRRREAEEKLEHHLEEARHKEGSADTKEDSSSAQEAKGDDDGAIDSGDVADIQNDDRLTAADRVDLIANQALASDAGGGPAPEDDKKA